MAFYVSSLLFCEVILGVIITIAGNEQGDLSSSSHWRQSPSAPVSFRQSSLLPVTFKNTKRLRHSRHLAARPGHNPSDVFSLDGYDTNTYGIGDSSFAQLAAKEQYNHKPVFTNCSRYAPSVEEDQPIGTYVLQVTATDPDPIDNGGKVTYSFVTGESRKFKIDPDTGEITTAHVFDRDEPKREKEVYVIVRATDNGRPTLDAVCSFKVTIEDINDNFPIFDKTKYEESVSQDLAVNREVIRVSATDIDDGNNSKILYEINATKPQDNGYFHIDKDTGIIYLDKKIDRDPGYIFSFKLVATDQGVVPTSNPTTLAIVVVESHKKAPSFTSVPSSPIRIKEKFSDFSYRIATITAISNTDEKAPLFELVTGRTEQTNSLGTFTLTSEGTTAYIQLARPLDYEMISEYLLNVRVQNKYKLAASTTIIIKVEDENDHIPQFTEVVFGSVLENEPPGTPVMQVRAIDTDSSPEFNTVTYELADNQEYFAIDRITGNITTLVSFDREKQDVYNVKVIATDSSPSALYGKNSTRHNQAEQVFRIEIVDKNDHPPRFTRPEYIADNISEDVNINSLVIEVKAIDNDTASPVSYSIVEGNIDNVFMIESATGKIRVNGILDYEKITNYTLKVRAFDGLYEDYCKVEVKITNVNDVPPQFLPHQNTATIQEETLEPGCLFKVEAYDPDIKDQNAPQHIVYSVLDNDQHSPFLKVDHDGCVSLIRKLDRDPPKGFSRWQALIKANDEDQGPNSQYNTTEVNIELIDINDNAPFLKMPKPVVWRENQEPGTVTTLIAEDNDTPSNGPPFKFSIAPSSSIEIKSKFNVQGSELIALQKFDREDKKFYLVPISISDSGSPPMTGTSTLTVTIGDENDNPMKKGSSSVFIYNYKGELGDTEIGRVYVEDPDDWDLPDKNFLWADVTPHPNFDLNSGTGMITMLPDTPDDTYTLKFTVWEQAL
uniref:Cadherin domain-containing protein n=1 Tax=Clastoptera arizonana TaxID=38151 RepID=A0A1B6C6Z7_9HEMI